MLARFEPVIRFNQGEYFLPASVEAFAGACELGADVIVAGGRLLVLGFLANWRALVVVGILLTIVGVFFVANLRELRRN